MICRWLIPNPRSYGWFVRHAKVDVVDGQLRVQAARFPALFRIATITLMVAPFVALAIGAGITLVLLLFVPSLPSLSMGDVLTDSVFVCYAAILLLSLRRLARYGRVLVGEVIVLDRAANQVLRNGQRIGFLDELEAIQWGTSGSEYSFLGSPGAPRFGVALRRQDGGAIWLLESSSEPETMELVNDLTRYTGLKQEPLSRSRYWISL